MGAIFIQTPPSQGESPSIDTLRRLIQEELGKQLEGKQLDSIASLRVRSLFSSLAPLGQANVEA